MRHGKHFQYVTKEEKSVWTKILTKKTPHYDLTYHIYHKKRTGKFFKRIPYHINLSWKMSNKERREDYNFFRGYDKLTEWTKPYNWKAHLEKYLKRNNNG